MSSQYYGLSGGRWQNQSGGVGDPYYYGLSEAPNMAGGMQNLTQPWHTQTGVQPGIVRDTSLGEKWSVNQGTGFGVDADGNKVGLGQAQPNFMLGEIPGDYQGRLWANELGGLTSGVSLKCVLICVVLAGAVSYGVSKYAK